MAQAYMTEAVLLKASDLGMADKIVQLFTRDRGRVRAVAYGARRPRSGLAGAMQLFNVLEVTLQPGEQLDTVRQAAVARRYPALAADLTAMAYAAFISELVIEFMPEGERNEDVFDWLDVVLANCGARNPRGVAMAAGWQMLTLAGLRPLYTSCAHCGKPIGADAASRFSIAEGGSLCEDCAGKLPPGKAVPHDCAAGTRDFMARLAGLDFKSPPSFSVRQSTLAAAETLLRQSLYEILGKRMKSLKFISQICNQ